MTAQISKEQELLSVLLRAGGNCGNRGTFADFSISTSLCMAFRVPGKCLIRSLPGWKSQNHIIYFPNYTTTSEKRIPKGLGMLLPTKKREDGKCTKPIYNLANLGPLAGSEEGSKFWKKKKSFHVLQIHQLFISKPLMIINTAIQKNLPFLYKSRVWREFHLIMILSITELALVRFGYHVCFIDKENEFLSNSLSHSLVCCSLHFGPDQDAPLSCWAQGVPWHNVVSYSLMP